MKRPNLSTLLLLLHCLLIASSLLFAQGEPDKAFTPATLPATKEGDLKTVIDTLNSLDEKINKTSRELASRGALGQEEGLREEITALTNQRNTLARNLEEIITGVDVTNVEVDSEETDLDLQRELTTLLGPLLLELKKLTSRPREIERLKRDSTALEKKKQIADKALARLDRMFPQLQDQHLKELLLQIKQKWEEQRQSLQAQLQVVSQKLQLKEAEQVPLTTSVSQIFQLFFRSRGRNIVIALVLSALFFFSLNRFGNILLTRPSIKPHLKRFEFRLFGIGLYFFSISGTICIFLITLYIFDDWVLLLLFSTLIIFGLWSSRTALVKFWRQITLILNIGPVREGEVVVVGNIPWRIERVNLYSQLVNPRLKGGKLRITANNLLSCQSRKQAQNEVFFPTEIEDWVLLGPEKTLVKVEYQTPEIVTVRLPGGGLQYYRASSFIDLSPTILTSGFRHTLTFGFHFRHQHDLLRTITPALDQFLRAKICTFEWGTYLNNLSIESLPPDTSALPLAILADFKGDAGPFYDIIKRALAGAIIECCTVHKWEIPYNQLVIHQA
jgi:hypothetical protein